MDRRRARGIAGGRSRDRCAAARPCRSADISWERRNARCRDRASANWISSDPPKAKCGDGKHRLGKSVKGFEDQTRWRTEEDDPTAAERGGKILRAPHRHHAAPFEALQHFGDVVDFIDDMGQPALQRLRKRIFIDDMGKQQQTLGAEEGHAERRVALRPWNRSLLNLGRATGLEEGQIRVQILDLYAKIPGSLHAALSPRLTTAEPLRLA